ncbi:MAG: hypothetical protein HUJ53_07730 [Holdemanella sp.]|nr:hypothetical protein [Holdemanella sp.]
MIRILVAKQWQEIFKSYHYNAKKNKARSKWGVIGWYAFFIVLMVGVLGGMFTFYSYLLCEPLCSSKLAWLYFIIMGIGALFLGVFGSVFNTFSSLYLSKDNDLLLSLPIPVDAIMISRLIMVYLMSLMYSAVVFVPAMLVYWFHGYFSIQTLFGCLAMLLVISILDLVLSCALGYVVARISLKIKNKGIVAALGAVLFIGLYYAFSYKIGELMETLLNNAILFGKAIKGSAYFLYLFGSMGEGNVVALLIYLAIAFGLLALTWFILKRSFVSITTSTAVQKKTVYKEKTVKQNGIMKALLLRELNHFTSSATYMLNCGLSILIIPLVSVSLLIFGNQFLTPLESLFGKGHVSVLICVIGCMMVSMADMAAPSVSLEGKNLWIVKSLPVTSWQVLKSKLLLQVVFAIVPMIFFVISGTILLIQTASINPYELFFVVVLPLIYTLLHSLLCLFWGVNLPNLNWTNEIYPIKQGLAVTLSLFGGWIIAIAFGGLYIWQGYKLGSSLYMMIGTILFSILSIILLIWLKTKGTKKFEEL